MGLVLKQRKFKFLGWAYRLFFLGISLALLIFVIDQVMALFV